MKFVNLTPHSVTIFAKKGLKYDPKTSSYNITPETKRLMKFEANPQPARCREKNLEESMVGGVPILDIVFKGIENLPAPQEGVIFLTSLIVAREAAKVGRTDLVFPARVVRDASGRVIGCSALSHP